MPKRILCYGEILWDLLPTGPVLGGATLNFAFRLHGLGDEAVLVSRLGDDDLGRAARREAEALHLPLSYVQTDPARPTGSVPVTFINGQPSYVITPHVAYDSIEPLPDLLEMAATVDCIYFGTLAQREAQSRETLYRILDAAPNALKFVDLNLRKDCYSGETVTESLQKANIVKLNDEEIAIVAKIASLPHSNPRDFALQLMQDWEVRCCIITLGSKGALSYSASGQIAVCPPIKIEVADTIGAGDSFAAGFVHELLGGSGIVGATRFGNIMGALAATKAGGTAEISPDEIDKFVEALQ